MNQKSQTANTRNKKPLPQRDNFVESIRDIGSGTLNSFRKDLLEETPKDFIRQLLGLEKAPVNASGEIKVGQAIEIEKILAAQEAGNQTLEAQLSHERSLHQEQQTYTARETTQLKLELKAVQEKTQEIASSMVGLSQEIKIATLQTVVEPGIYHLNFFQAILSFLESFRKKISQANLWLASANRKAQKRRTFWGQVSKGGAQRLLSGEDYSQRSAG